MSDTPQLHRAEGVNAAQWGGAQRSPSEARMFAPSSCSAARASRASAKNNSMPSRAHSVGASGASARRTPELTRHAAGAVSPNYSSNAAKTKTGNNWSLDSMVGLSDWLYRFPPRPANDLRATLRAQRPRLHRYPLAGSGLQNLRRFGTPRHRPSTDTPSPPLVTHPQSPILPPTPILSTQGHRSPASGNGANPSPCSRRLKQHPP